MTLIDLEDWEHGLELLVETRATNESALLAARIKDELAKARLANDTNAVDVWTSRLAQVDMETARLLLRRHLSSQSFDHFAVGHLAARLMREGDLTGFDLLVEKLRQDEPLSPHLHLLAAHLASWFHYRFELEGGGFPSEFLREFLEWYTDVRPRLAGKHRGFALGDEIAFGTNYYASMLPYKQKTASRLQRKLSRESIY